MKKAPFHRPFATKNRAPLKREALFLLSAFPVFTRSLNSFVRANKSKIQLHSVALHSAVLLSFALYFFSGCSYDQQLGFAPLSLCIILRNASLFFIISPTLHALSISLPHSSSVLILRLLVICRNTAPCSSKNIP